MGLDFSAFSFNFLLGFSLPPTTGAMKGKAQILIRDIQRSCVKMRDRRIHSPPLLVTGAPRATSPPHASAAAPFCENHRRRTEGRNRRFCPRKTQLPESNQMIWFLCTEVR